MAFRAWKGIAVPQSLLKVPKYSSQHYQQLSKYFGCLSSTGKSQCQHNALNIWISHTATRQEFFLTSLNWIFTRTLTNQAKSTVLFRRQSLFKVFNKRYQNLVRSFVRYGATDSSKQAQAVNKAIQKSPVKQTEIKQLLALAKPERWKLTAAVMLLMVSSAVTLAVPYSIGRVIDIIYSYITQENMVQKLREFSLILLVVFIIGGLANFGRVYLMHTASNRIIKRLRENIFSTIMKQEIAFFDKNKTGELINRLSTDTTIVGQSLTGNISDGLRSSLQAVAGVSMMVYMSPKLAGVALCIVPPVILLSRIYGRFVRNITKKVQDSLAKSTEVAEERVSNMRTVRAFAQEQKEIKSYSDQVEEVLQLSYKEALAKAIFWGSTGMSGNLMMLSILYYGGIMMQDAQITVGELSSFMLYAFTVGFSVAGLSTFYTELMRGLGASSRLFELQQLKPAIPLQDGLIPTKKILGELEFIGVDFSYPSRSDVDILKNFNLKVQHGEILAVVGPSGSGKSTLASLLLRYYDPIKGQLLIDGMDLRTLSPYWLRSHMGIVSQEPTLFSCSIADNIAYGSLDLSSVSKSDVTEAARMANALHFIEQFPQGFNTKVGERGIMLSGGQKQRIAIARAILKDPEILLLDEATSALDAESEHLVQEALERVMVGRTVITIAHRLSTIKHADTIAVLDRGQVIEQGSYEQLMMLQDGLFRKLVERQTITSS